GAMFQLPRHAGGMQAEGGIELPVLEIELARDQERAAQLLDRLLRRELRPLVEPLWHEKLGRRPDRPALALHLDLDQHKSLRRRIDDDRAEAERPRKRDGPFEEGDVAYGDARCHDEASATFTSPRRGEVELRSNSGEGSCVP